MVHRFETEIELSIEDEIELATEVKTNFLFDEKCFNDTTNQKADF